MKRVSQIRSCDVPQADSFPLIRRVVEAVGSGQKTVVAISQQTGFSDRHVRYRLQAARVLGLVSPDLCVTTHGRRLIGTASGSEEELNALRDCLRDSEVLSFLVPDFFVRENLDVTTAAKRIQALAGLSFATAERRARVLRSWHRRLVNPQSGKKNKTALQ